MPQLELIIVGFPVAAWHNGPQIAWVPAKIHWASSMPKFGNITVESAQVQERRRAGPDPVSACH